MQQSHHLRPLVDLVVEFSHEHDHEAVYERSTSTVGSRGPPASPSSTASCASFCIQVTPATWGGRPRVGSCEATWASTGAAASEYFESKLVDFEPT